MNQCANCYYSIAAEDGHIRCTNIDILKMYCAINNITIDDYNEAAVWISHRQMIFINERTDQIYGEYVEPNDSDCREYMGDTEVKLNELGL